MAIRSGEYENPVARGILKAAAKNADSIDQYVKTASDLLADARRPSNSSHGRTRMAYEGLFSLAMAGRLSRYVARPPPAVATHAGSGATFLSSGPRFAVHRQDVDGSGCRGAGKLTEPLTDAA